MPDRPHCPACESLITVSYAAGIAWLCRVCWCVFDDDGTIITDPRKDDEHGSDHQPPAE